MSTITLDGPVLVWRTPYNKGLLDDLKRYIPPSDRQWDGTQKAWRVSPSHANTLVELTQVHLGERIIAPTVTVRPTLETRLVEVRYIGSSKDRGGDDRSAFGWADGGWTVMFPEKVLREWFDAPRRPDEETTLYQVLAVKQDADSQAVKQSYRRLSKQWHPDICKEPGAAEVFRRITDAYQLLSDPAKRARYDAGLRLTATLGVQRVVNPLDQLHTYRSPLRCGLIMCEGVASLKFVIERILAWEDITNEYGQTLNVSWPLGADRFQEAWV